MYLSTHNPGADLLTSVGEDCPADPLRVEPLQVLCVVRRLAGMDSTYHEKGKEMRRVHIFFYGGCWWTPGGGGALTQRHNVSGQNQSHR